MYKSEGSLSVSIGVWFVRKYGKLEEKFEVSLNLVYFFALKQCNQKKKSIFVCLVAEKVREIGGRIL